MIYCLSPLQRRRQRLRGAPVVGLRLHPTQLRVILDVYVRLREEGFDARSARGVVVDLLLAGRNTTLEYKP